MARASTVEDHVGAGREALARGSWEDARRSFEAALRERESAEAWEGLSWAAWWLEDGDAAIDAREHAYALHREAGDRQGVARMAVWIANDVLEFKGAEAVSAGWFERAEGMLAELEPSPEHGWLAALKAYNALERGEPAAAREEAAVTREIGNRFGLVGLEMLGRATEGLALVTEGEVERGMRCLDTAAAAALGGDFEDIAGVGWACCYLFYACERVRDYDRAAQWCREAEQFAERRRMEFLRGNCLAHYAGVLMWHGRWGEAEALLEQAAERLAGTRPFYAPEAVVRLAELRRRQGRLDEAAELFAGVEWHPLACVGLGELALARGDLDGAAELAERVLRRFGPDNRTLRAGALELLARARAAQGDEAAAGSCLEELRGVAEAAPTEPLRAAVSLTEGMAAAAAGDHEAARPCLEDAAELFRQADGPFETARARLELASTLAALGRADGALREAGAAVAAFTGLGAEAEARRARTFLARLGDRGESPLTARELEVLRLVAEGLGDRDIAAALTISEHTVHRHVANIHAKLGCSTRAAAVAQASRLGLL